MKNYGHAIRRKADIQLDSVSPLHSPPKSGEGIFGDPGCRIMQPAMGKEAVAGRKRSDAPAARANQEQIEKCQYKQDDQYFHLSFSPIFFQYRTV